MLKRFISVSLARLTTILLVVLCVWIGFYAFEKQLVKLPLIFLQIYAWLPTIISIVTSIIIVFSIVYAVIINNLKK